MTNDNTTTTPSPAVVAARTAPRVPVTVARLNVALEEETQASKALHAAYEGEAAAREASAAARDRLRQASARVHQLIDGAREQGGVR